ncbi:MAG: hypothetical protein ACYC2T_06490 [Bacillota bacterium]
MLPDVIAMPLDRALALLAKNGFALVEQKITTASGREEPVEGVFRVVRSRKVGLNGVSLVLTREATRGPVKGGGT